MKRLVLAAALVACLIPTARAQCLTTLFGANGGTSVGGAVYFDMRTMAPILVDSLEVNFLASPGTAVGLDLYVRTGTSVGFETSIAGWTLAALDDGASLSNGFDIPTPITLSVPLSLPTGLSGIALVARGSGHARTNGNGANQLYSDGTLTLELGASANSPFSASVFSPHVWNGTICYRAILGTKFCTPAVPNATGLPASITASGRLFIAANDFRLTIRNLPPGIFVLPLLSRTTDNVPMAGGSQGTLCLGTGAQLAASPNKSALRTRAE